MTTLLAGALLAVAAVPAEAATSRYFRLATEGEHRHADGRARATGTVTFLRGNRVQVSGRIDDVCDANGDGDGYAAVLHLTPWVDGRAIASSKIAVDDRGCTERAVPFSVTRRLPGRVTKVRLNLQEQAVNELGGTLFGDIDVVTLRP